MNYVYILQSVSNPDQFYTGLCADVKSRLAAHNAGQSPHTSKYKPWPLISAHYFADPDVAVAFERYLKTGSGRAFAAKRLRTTQASGGGAVPAKFDSPFWSTFPSVR